MKLETFKESLLKMKTKTLNLDSKNSKIFEKDTNYSYGMAQSTMKSNLLLSYKIIKNKGFMIYEYFCQFLNYLEVTDIIYDLI